MKLYWINIRTLQVFKDDNKSTPKHYEVGFMCETLPEAVIKFVNWVDEVPGRMHKTFNTTAKKDVIKYILNEQKENEVLTNR